MTKNKLISMTGFIFFGIFFYQPPALAEYYYSGCGAEAVEFIESVSRPHCYRKHIRHHRRHHYCHRVHHCRSCADLSIYYIWDSFPPACSCNPCPTYTRMYFGPTSDIYTIDQYNAQFDFDRRTADDIGNDMDIDY